jgi:hypothetical protein
LWNYLVFNSIFYGWWTYNNVLTLYNEILL